MATQNWSPDPSVHNRKPYKRVEGTHQIVHFFRAAAELDIDKEDLKRYYDFVDQKIADLLLMAQHTAKSNDRTAVEPRDLPGSGDDADDGHHEHEGGHGRVPLLSLSKCNA